MTNEYRVRLEDLLGGNLGIKTKVGGIGTVQPPTREKLDREIAELRASGEKPAKLKALLAVRATMGS